MRGNWSVRGLKCQVASLYFERSGLSRNKARLAELAHSTAGQTEPKLVIRDPYVFEFLGLRPQDVLPEADLEVALLAKLEAFLLELGHGFCFKARQKRLLIGAEAFFVDLVFYHRVLKCHVLVELKVDEFRHEHLGQLNTYVRRFTAMALKAGIAWHLGPQRLDELSIHFISDVKDRASRPDRGMIDNFENYLLYRAELDAFLNHAGNRAYPWVNLELSLQDSANDDLLQLCDPLLGATQMALVAGASRPTKRELGETVARWCEDLRRPMRQQVFKLQRKFSLWASPDQDGKPYNRVPLALRANDGQASLF